MGDTASNAISNKRVQAAQGKRAAKQPRRSNPLLAIDDMEDDQEVEDKEGDLLFGKTAFMRMPNGT